MAETLEEIVSSLRDALTVTAAMAQRHETRLKDHQQWLEANERAIAKHREFIEQHEAVMGRLDEKLEQIADLILRSRGSNGRAE